MDITLSPHRLQHWGFKGGITILDQGLFSGANFLASILLARWLTPTEYGAYALSFAILMFFYQLHTSIILSPMGVIGPAAHGDNLSFYLQGQARLHFLLTAAFGILVVLSGLIMRQIPGEIGLISPILLVMGALLPFLLLPWLIRRSFYILGRPWVAAAGSAVYCAFLGGSLFGLYKMRILTAPLSVAAMALAGLISGLYMSLYLVSDLSTVNTNISQISLQDILRENWAFGKWLTLAAFLVIGASQAPVFFSGFMLTLDEAGTLRALQTLSQPMTLTITAVTALVIPAMSADYSNGNFASFHGKARSLTKGLIVAALLFELFLILFRFPLEQALYGGKFSKFADIIPIWGLFPLLSAVNSGISCSLQACQKPKALLIASVYWMAASIVLTYALIVWHGFLGAMISLPISFLVYLGVIAALYWRWSVSQKASEKAQGLISLDRI